MEQAIDNAEAPNHQAPGVPEIGPEIVQSEVPTDKEAPLLAPLPPASTANPEANVSEASGAGPWPPAAASGPPGPLGSASQGVPATTEQQPSDQSQPVSAAALQPRMANQYPTMPNFTPHPGMPGMPLGNGAYWLGPTSGPPQGQIVYASNAGWLGPQSYVGPQQGGVRPPYQPLPQAAFYPAQSGMHIQQHGFQPIQPAPSGEQTDQGASQNAASNSAGVNTSTPDRPATGLLGLVMGMNKPGEGMYSNVPHSNAQQFGAQFIPGQFMAHLQGQQPPRGPEQGQEGQPSVESLQILMNNQGLPRPAFWPGMPINQHSIVHGGAVYPVKAPEAPAQDQPAAARAAPGTAGQEQPQAQQTGMSAFVIPPPSHPRASHALPLLPKDIQPAPRRVPSIIDPGNVKDSERDSATKISSAEGATGPDGEVLFFQPVRGASSRRRRSGTHFKEDAPAGQTAGNWAFLPGTTSSGRRRRRHPVAEVKGNWTPEEDAKLVELVKQHGVGNWSKLLPEFQGRIGKQLRERWNHELRPDINKEGWTHEEECGLIEAHKKHGNCWAEIAKVLHGRTQNGIKNHWHATMRKVNRAPAHANPSTPLQAYLKALARKSVGGLEDQISDRGLAQRDEAESPKGRKRGAEYLEEEGFEPAKRAATSPKVGNVGFHLRFEEPARRSGSPGQEGERARPGPHKRLNAEELGVAEGLLGLQEARHNTHSPEGTDSEDDMPAPQVRQPTPRRRPLAAPAQPPARRQRGAREESLDQSEEPGAVPSGIGTLGSIVSNTAVAVEGLRKVGALELEGYKHVLAKAIESDRLNSLAKHLREGGLASQADAEEAASELCSMIKRFVGLPDLWALYDVLKQEELLDDKQG